jgi:hypothetical protein
VVKIKHDDFCPCTRFHTQPEFCNCGAVECENDINAGLERFGKRLREINRAALTQEEAKP